MQAEEPKLITFHFLYSESHSVMSDSLRPHGLTIQSMRFSMPEYWSGEPFPSPGDLPKLRSPALQVDSLPAEPPWKPYLKNLHVNTFYRNLLLAY